MTAMQLAATAGVCLIVYAVVRLPGAVRQFRRDWRRAGRLLHDARAIDPPHDAPRPDGDGNAAAPPPGPVTTIMHPCGCAHQFVHVNVSRCHGHKRQRIRPVPDHRRDRKPGSPA
jgi:hypothetical protein